MYILYPLRHMLVQRLVPLYQHEKTEVSREVLALTGGKAPIMVTPSGLKEKRKIQEKLQKWVWQPFINPARAPDRTPFYHWANKSDELVAEEYAFSVLNKKIKAFTYTDNEWNTIIKEMDEQASFNLDPSDTTWTREETDALMALCKKYDLRFIVIHDQFPRGGKSFTIEQMKKRYYDIARKLVESRIKDREEALKNPILKTVYDFEGEVKRKEQAEYIFNRPKEIEQKEELLREQLRQIEAIKKKRQDEEKKAIADKTPKKKGRKKKAGKTKNNVNKEAAPIVVQHEPDNGDVSVQEVPTLVPTTPLDNSQNPSQEAFVIIEEEKEESSEDEQDSLSAKVIKQLRPGGYARSSLMTPSEYSDKSEIDTMITSIMHQHEIHRAPMPTSKIHESYEILRDRMGVLINLKKKVVKSELTLAKLTRGSQSKKRKRSSKDYGKEE
ncbi:DNA methyltransferase 1-associated protein [Acrasis kona]|uniref:DNA methyltransferase 1-associated protein n=1 Tax=Acrasis kona TaxID=1008807 RepID=A0AAW2ZAR2_9EUKA